MAHLLCNKDPLNCIFSCNYIKFELNFNAVFACMYHPLSLNIVVTLFLVSGLKQKYHRLYLLSKTKGSVISFSLFRTLD